MLFYIHIFYSNIQYCLRVYVPGEISCMMLSNARRIKEFKECYL